MIRATFTITEKQYIELQKLYLSKTSANLIRYELLVVLGFSLMAVAITAKHLWATDWTKLLFPILMLLVIIFSPFLQNQAFRKRYKIESAGLTNVTVELDEIGYRSSVEGQGRGEILWSAFTSYCETQTMIALFKGFAFYGIPKGALSSEDCAAALQLISSRLPVHSRKLAKVQGR